jgi:hypothetical protein
MPAHGVPYEYELSAGIIPETEGETTAQSAEQSKTFLLITTRDPAPGRNAFK